MCAVSGSVEEVSSEVAGQTGLKRGDSVMALVGGGGYAGQSLSDMVASKTSPV